MAGVARRRLILGASAALLPWPGRVVRAELPKAADVAVIGAGMAGLTAARLLIERGRRAVVIEARNRPGGRAFTDTATFGVPVDFGAGELRALDDNPLTAVVGRTFRNLVPDDGDFWMFVGADEATVVDYDALGAALDEIDRTVEAARNANRDRPLATEVRVEGRWSDVARALAGPIATGVDFDRLSAVDAYREGSSGSDGLVLEGLGSFVTAYGRDVPVVLDTPVTAIRWDERAVLVETTAGPLNATTAIVTVPTGVLATQPEQKGGIRFMPELPDWKRDAIRRLPMGLINKIALQFRRDEFGAPPNTDVVYLAQGREVMSFRMNPLGQPVVVARVGGTYARALEAKGEAAMIAAARERLRDIFGAKADAGFLRGKASAWGADPWARGAVSAAEPGHAGARRLLARSLAGRLFFAGEACADEWITQLPGAYLSGRRAAGEVLRILG